MIQKNATDFNVIPLFVIIYVEIYKLSLEKQQTCNRLHENRKIHWMHQIYLEKIYIFNFYY